jgi:HlyD family secretion protein
VWGGPGGPDAAAEAIFTVEEGPLTISVSEPGTIKNRDQVVIKSEVEGRAAILFLVKEGTRVKQGDLVVELDSKAIEDQRASQAITVTRRAVSSTRGNLAVVRSRPERRREAELDLFAELTGSTSRRHQRPSSRRRPTSSRRGGAARRQKSTGRRSPR